MSVSDLQRALIQKVRDKMVPRIRDDLKFLGRDRLIARFEDQFGRWQPGPGRTFSQILETINEIAAAVAMLDSSEDITELAYEPRLSQTDRTIDFRITFASGRRCWIDVKTVAPEWRDDDAGWKRFEAIATGFPSNARLVVDKNLAGAALSGLEIKARWTFIQRTRETEQKEALLSPEEKAPVRLLFCSNGALRKDALEDFADFYLTGRFRPDDWMQNAVARYMQDEKVVLAQTLVGFSYLYLRWETGEVEDFEIDVRGPQIQWEPR
jgi:hypothetical protein